ncbi:hypothetical protein K41_19905, partial [Klebsiella pneumoniae]
MSEPLKPRIDFDGPLQAEKIPPLKGARAFDTLEADNFAPARLVTGEEEEGAAEAVVGVGPATQTQPVAADGQRRTGDLRRQRRGARRAVD